MALVFNGTETDNEILLKRIAQLRQDVASIGEVIDGLVSRRHMIEADMTGILCHLEGMNLLVDGSRADSQDEAVSADPEQDPEVNDTCLESGFVQGSLFNFDGSASEGSGKGAENESQPSAAGRGTDSHRRAKGAKERHWKPGYPKVTRREALRNLRQIEKNRAESGKSDRLDLSEVNMIFGFNPSTSGTFIKNAIRRGELITTRYRSSEKFYSYDVRSFIDRCLPA